MKNDPRIKKVGRIIRKLSIDEISQLINVLKGDMSFVGPRPEVRKYVDLYTSDQLQILKVKPGITDWASIEYSNENQILSTVSNPEEYYISTIMPHKLMLNHKYLSQNNLLIDFKIIFLTFTKALRN